MNKININYKVNEDSSLLVLGSRASPEMLIIN